MPKTYWIIPGFAEGHWHTKKFRTALEAAGIKPSDGAEEAELIVTHSGGCYFLPKVTGDQTFMLIAPPYTPGKPLIISVAQKIYRDRIYYMDNRILFEWLLKGCWNTIYILRHPIHAITLTLRARQHNFHERLGDKRVILVRNTDDPWCSEGVGEPLPSDKRTVLRLLPGDHDDCWHNPEAYLKLLD